MNLFENGKKVIKILNNHGYLGYLVGGAVRDYLINRPIHDIDITTNATPEVVKSIFSKVILTGLKHGTVTVILDNIPFEITTFRKEGEYTDYRHPDQVVFVDSLEEDLARRDFTINSMAMDKDGVIIDPFKGRQDIKQKIIRAVGNANDRFLEDPLRMLRAIRFASQLKFKIDEETWDALDKNAKLISHIAIERIKLELDRIISSPSPENGLYYIYQSKLIYWIKGLQHSKILDIDLQNLLKQIKQTQNPFLRWALYLSTLSNTERLKLMQLLKMSKKEIANFEQLFLACQILEQPTALTMKRCLIQHNLDCCLDAIELNAILEYIHYTKKEELTKELILMDKELSVRSRKDLAINGNDLIKFFQKASGPWIKELLDKLLTSVTFKELPNTRSALLEEAKRIRMGNDEK